MLFLLLKIATSFYCLRYVGVQRLLSGAVVVVLSLYNVAERVEEQLAVQRDDGSGRRN